MRRKIDPATFARTLVNDPGNRRWAWRIGLVAALIGILGFLAVPPLLKTILEEKLGEALHRDVTIAAIRFNPYTLTAQLDGVSVRERADGKTGEEVFGFDSLKVNGELASLAVAGVVIKEVSLQGPRFRLVREPNRRYNISDLIDAWLARPASTGATPRFSVSNIRIGGGRIDFDDRPEGVRHAITDIELQLPFVSSLSFYADSDVEPRFSAQVDGAPLVLNGRSRPFDDSLASELTLDLDRLQLAPWLAYLPVDLAVRLASGALDGDLHLRFARAKDKPATFLLFGKLAIKDLRLEEAGGAPLLAVKRLDVALREVDLVKRTVSVAGITLASPELSLPVDPSGRLVLPSFLAIAAPGDALPQAPPAASTRAPPKAQSKMPPGAKAASVATTSGTFGPTAVGIDAIVVDNAQILLRDRVPTLAGKSGGKQAAPASQLLAGWDQLLLDRVSIDLKNRDGKAELFTARGGQIRLTRTPEGGLRGIAIAAAAPGAPPPALTQTVPVEAENALSWRWSLKRLQLENQNFRFEDRSLTPASIQTLVLTSLEAGNLASDADATTTLSGKLRVNEAGELGVSGSARIMQSQAELRIDAKGIALLPLQPYFGRALNVSLTGGQLAANGVVTLGRAAEGLSFGYTGDLTLGDVHSVDRVNSADFMNWKSLHFDGLAVRSLPLSISVSEVALSDFYARAIVSPEGKLNLLQAIKHASANADGQTGAEQEAGAAGVVRSGAEAGPQGGARAPAAVEPVVDVVPVTIGKLTLQGGQIRFTDNFVKPNYSAKLTGISGKVSGLSSAAGTEAELDLRGSYDKRAPLLVKARLNPLAARRSLDLDAEVTGVELTSLSTYAAKYAGYDIERGKLSLFLKYRIADRELVASNRILLDQLTFGDPVDSPDATKLPVLLAVALLKNRDGEIDINLPISGSLDDPQFSVGGIVVRLIGNLFVKAVTSPFALLGSIFGGGEELAWVEFEPGSAALTEAMVSRLKSLARALEERPSLRLDVAGRVDPAADREGLRHALLLRRVKAQRLQDLVAQGKPATSVDDVTIEARDYPRYLERAYLAEKFPKPRNMIGLTKTLPVAEMEALMLANMKVDDDALRRLANRRAQAVGEWLAESGGIPAGRVFFLNPNLAADEGPQNDKATQRRVDFSLK